MSLDAVNAFIADWWTQYRAEAVRMLGDKAQNSPPSTQTNGNLTLDGMQGAFYITAPPGFLQLSKQRITIAAPLDETGWSLRLAGYLNAAVLGTVLIKNQALTVLLSNLRLTVDAALHPGVTMLGDPDARPHLVSLNDLNIGLNLDLDIPELHLSVRSQHAAGGDSGPGIWQQEGVLHWVAHVTFDLGPLIDPIRQLTFDGTLTLDLNAKTIFSLDGNFQEAPLPHPLHLNIQTPAPDLLQLISDALRNHQFPPSWPPTLSESEPPVPAFDPPGNLHDAALAIEQAVKTHEHPGTLFDHAYRMNGDAITNELRAYVGERDSAIWTGHLLAALAFHYAVAPAGAEKTDVLDHASTVLGGIEKLFAVPAAAAAKDQPAPDVSCRDVLPLDLFDSRGLVCRSVLPENEVANTNPPYDHPNRFDPNKRAQCEPTPTNADLAARETNYYSASDNTAVFDGTRWYGFGRDNDPPSRDQIIGLVQGFACAYHLMNDVPAAPLRERIAALVTPLLDYLLANHWNVPTPAGVINAGQTRTRARIWTFFTTYPHMQLALLRLGKTVAPDRFGASYDAAAEALAETCWFSVWFNCCEPVLKYYKFNLDMSAVTTLLLLENEGDDNSNQLRTHYQDVLQMLRQTTRAHRNAYFNLLYVIGQDAADRPAALADTRGFNRGLTLALETHALQSQWLQRRNRVPGPNLLPRQKSADESYLLDLAANGFAVTYGAVKPTDALYAPFPLPPHTRPGAHMDFMWQHDSFDTGLKLGTDNKPALRGDCADVESPGVDYLLAYWMGRFVGLPDTVEMHRTFLSARAMGTVDALDLPAHVLAALTANVGIQLGNIDDVLRYMRQFAAFRAWLPFGRPPATLREFAQHHLIEFLGKSPDPDNERQIKAWFKQNVLNGNDIPDDSFANLGRTMLEFFSYARQQSIEGLWTLVYLTLAEQARQACSDVLDELSLEELRRLPAGDIFDASARVSIRTQIAASELRNWSVPWGPPPANPDATIADEIDAILGKELSL